MSSVDEKGRLLQGRLDFFDRNIKELDAGLKSILQSHKDGALKSEKFARTINEIAAQEEFLDLQEDLLNISNTMSRNAEERKKILCERGEEKVLTISKSVKEQIVQPMKLLLKDRQRALKKLENAHKKFGDPDARKNILTTEPDITQSDMVDMMMCVKNTEEIVDSNFRVFEKQRIIELKIMLEEALRAEMLYHCRALEILEPVCVAIRSLDADKAMHDMTKRLYYMQNSNKQDGNINVSNSKKTNKFKSNE